jgi:hypothetical protein
MKLIFIFAMLSCMIGNLYAANCHCRIKLNGADVYDPGVSPEPGNGGDKDAGCLKACREKFLDANKDQVKKSINMEAECAKYSGNKTHVELDLIAWGRYGAGGVFAGGKAHSYVYDSLICDKTSEKKCLDGQWLSDDKKKCQLGASIAEVESLIKSSNDTNGFKSKFDGAGLFVWKNNLYKNASNAPTDDVKFTTKWRGY